MKKQNPLTQPALPFLLLFHRIHREFVPRGTVSQGNGILKFGNSRRVHKGTIFKAGAVYRQWLWKAIIQSNSEGSRSHDRVLRTRRGSSYRKQMKSWIKATLREAATSLEGHSQPLATPEEGIQKNYILTSCSLPLDPTHWKPRGKRTCCCMDEAAIQGNKQKAKEKKVDEGQMPPTPGIIHHWSLDTLNKFTHGCADFQFPVLYFFFRIWCFQILLAKHLH